MLIGFILGVCFMFLICGPVAIITLVACRAVGTVYKKLALHYVRTKLTAYDLYLKDPKGKYHLSQTYYIETVLEPLLYKEEDNATGYFKFRHACENAKSIPWWSYVIGKNGFKDKKKAHSSDVLNAIRPYTELYRKIEHGA